MGDDEPAVPAVVIADRRARIDLLLKELANEAARGAPPTRRLARRPAVEDAALAAYLAGFYEQGGSPVGLGSVKRARKHAAAVRGGGLARRPSPTCDRPRRRGRGFEREGVALLRHGRLAVVIAGLFHGGMRPERGERASLGRRSTTRPSATGCWSPPAAGRRTMRAETRDIRFVTGAVAAAVQTLRVRRDAAISVRRRGPQARRARAGARAPPAARAGAFPSSAATRTQGRPSASSRCSSRSPQRHRTLGPT